MSTLMGHSNQAHQSAATSSRNKTALTGAQRGKTTALVVSVNHRKAYPIIKSLKKMKYTTVGAFYRWNAHAFSWYLDHRYRIANPYENEKTYLKQISQLMDQYNPVVIPVGFIDVLLLTNYRKSLSKKGVILAPDHVDIKKAANKAILNRVSQSTGIRYPTTEQITQRSWKKALNSIGLPLVVKSASTVTNPQCVFHVSDLERIVASRRGPLIAQQFIPGSETGYFTIAANGYILAEYAYHQIIKTQPCGGPSLVACHDSDSPVYDLGRKITRHLSWSGPLLIEFRKHEETGDYYLIGLNPTFSDSLELATAWNLDFPQYLLHCQEYGWTTHPSDSPFPSPGHSRMFFVAPPWVHCLLPHKSETLAPDVRACPET